MFRFYKHKKIEKSLNILDFWQVYSVQVKFKLVYHNIIIFNKVTYALEIQLNLILNKIFY